MAVKEGYKQTEVGVIPEDWECTSFGEVLRVRHGKSQHDVSDKNGLYPILASGGIIGFANSYLYDKPSVLIGRKGTIDVPQYMDTPFWTIDTLFYSEIYNNAVAKYVYYTFQTIEWYIFNEASGVPSLNAKTIESIKFAKPPLPEQKAIATALSDIDGLIDSLSKLIEKKKNIKQGAMQELLTGKKRIEGFSGEWVEVKVSSFGEIVTGSTPPTGNLEYWNGDIPWVTPTDIKGNKNIFKSERCITIKGLSIIRQLKANSILVTCIASIGKNAILKVAGASNQQINAIMPNHKYNSDFLYYLFENNKQYLLSKAGITATNIVSKIIFSDMLFSVPSTIEEQTVIATILSDMDSEIEKHQVKLDKYKAIKQGMMQELLTGRIRLLKGA